ncbi:MAG: serine/threonine-protein kinase [Myxococcota bacterium]
MPPEPIPRSEAGSSAFANSSELHPGHRIGRYVLRQRLGQGGMGVVYAAHDEQLDRTVALKLLRPDGGRGEAGEERRQRLLREAQAMAQLSHPNVVEVYDVGTDADALYIAMALVQGQTLRTWMHAADDRPWQETAAMFEQAGRGLAAAHEVELVHRDFKPANVLVDEQGRAQVLDFGLALPTLARRSAVGLSTGGASASDSLIIERSSTATDRLASPLTEFGVVMGTPAYMAPEQHVGDEVGPPADQYAFCVALWEALHGERPFRARNEKAMLHAKSKGPPASPPGIGVPRAVLSVLARGMAVDASQRWPSMVDLLDALSPRVRSTRRRRRAAARVALGGAAALAFAIASRRSEPTVEGPCRELAELSSQWDGDTKAEVSRVLARGGESYAADTAKRVEQGIDDYVSRWSVVRAEACAELPTTEDARALQRRRLACLERRRRRAVAMVEVLADPQTDAVSRAVPLVHGLPSLEVCASEDPEDDRLMVPDDPALAQRVREAQAELEVVRAWLAGGRYDDAHTRAQQILEGARALKHAPLIDLAEMWLGETLMYLGQFEAAKDHMVEVLHRAEAADQDAMVVELSTRLVFIEGTKLGRPEAGLRWGRHGEARLSRGADDGFAEAHLRTAIGSALTDAGRVKEAQKELERAVELWTALEGADDIQTAAARNNLGIAFYGQGRYERAIVEYEEVARIRRLTLGPEHPDIAAVLNNLANARFELGEYDRALKEQREVHRIWRAALGPDHPNVGAILNNLGNSASTLGRYEEALDYYDQAKQLRERVLGPDHPELAVTLLNLGGVLGDMKRYDPAVTALRQAREILEQRLGEHTWTATAIAALGMVQLARGDHEAALAACERALNMERQFSGPQHPQVAMKRVLVGEALLALDRPEQARPHLERALEVLQAGEVSPDELAKARFALARALAGQGEQTERVVQLVAQAREVWEGAPLRHAQRLEELEAWHARTRGKHDDP